MSDALPPLAGFSGIARLFPLPNLVLFPQVMQPLHIFEPRYRQMTVDALEDDRLIALVLLRPGWQAEYAACPAIHSLACLGKIVADQRLEDGRYNILLRGLSRIRIVHELMTDTLYRQARVELVADTEPPGLEAETCLRKKIVQLAPCWFPAQGNVQEQFRKLLRSDLPLSTLADIIAFALPLETEFKQTLLEEPSVERRLKRLLKALESQSAPGTVLEEEGERRFPPEFSTN